ncbi:hypothetical protein CPE01_28460 [Cellulomonas persica]|uniref:Uncharacterized protein n=1 Tax=Cellulomonas persica TaxID=76861 RepID=A0A510UWP3_9CELL|nr:hypothetical protein CPE01_28460 [Cellulomonas persica]
MSVPAPATPHATSAPATPVDCANCRGSEKTPAPTIDPTTSIAMVGTLRRVLAGATDVLAVLMRPIQHRGRSARADVRPTSGRRACGTGCVDHLTSAAPTCGRVPTE